MAECPKILNNACTENLQSIGKGCRIKECWMSCPYNEAFVIKLKIKEILEEEFDGIIWFNSEVEESMERIKEKIEKILGADSGG